MHDFQGEVVERLHDDPFLGLIVIDFLQQLFLYSLVDVVGALDFDEQPTGIAFATHLREEFEDFIQRRELLVGQVSFGILSPVPPDFLECHIPDFAFPVCRPIDALVVTNDYLSIFREMDVNFYHVGSSLDSFSETVERVFRAYRSPTTMSYYQHIL